MWFTKPVWLTKIMKNAISECSIYAMMVHVLVIEMYKHKLHSSIWTLDI